MSNEFSPITVLFNKDFGWYEFKEKVVTVFSLFIGGIVSSHIVWKTIDIFVGLLTIINTYSIFILRDVVVNKVRSSN